MLYQLYEFNHAALAPVRAMADGARVFWSNPGNPLSGTYMGRSMAASLNLFERLTRRYAKPQFNIEQVMAAGRLVDVRELSLIHI